MSYSTYFMPPGQTLAKDYCMVLTFIAATALYHANVPIVVQNLDNFRGYLVYSQIGEVNLSEPTGSLESTYWINAPVLAGRGFINT